MDIPYWQIPRIKQSRFRMFEILVMKIVLFNNNQILVIIEIDWTIDMTNLKIGVLVELSKENHVSNSKSGVPVREILGTITCCKISKLFFRWFECNDTSRSQGNDNSNSGSIFSAIYRQSICLQWWFKLWLLCLGFIHGTINSQKWLFSSNECSWLFLASS